MSGNSNGLIGLSILSGTDSFTAFATPTIESRAQRQAKAAFTTKETVAPWKATPSTLPVSSQISTIKGMKTIIDKATTGTATPLPDDIQTSFTTYKALDRLRLLAESASKDTTSSAERPLLEKSFAKGLADLETFLASAPSDQVDIAFAKTARQAQTVGIKSASSMSAATVPGKGVRDTRTGALSGMTGNEKLRITLSQPGAAPDIITVDLSTTPQPPTLDSVADALNTAIGAVSRRDANGQPVLDADGKQVPRWSAVKFVPSKYGDKWGMGLNRAGFESVAIDQVGGADALMVAGGVTPAKGKTDTRITRFDDPAGTMTRRTLDSITAIDRPATDRQKVAADADPKGKVKATTVFADTRANAIATDAQGFSYVVGTSAGDVGANRSDGNNDLLLSKVDSEGKVVWKRTLGAAGSADGASVTIAPDGGIVVAGTITGSLDGTKSDGDMLVARFDANGDETFSTAVRSVGAESASAVAVGPDGAIYVGGRSSTGGGDAYLARLSATGKLVERRTIDSGGTDQVKALAIGADGQLLALTSEKGKATLRRIDKAALATDLGSIDLGRADARALAVAADGSIAVAGATDAALSGNQTNNMSGGRDGFVTRIDAGLSGSRTTYLGSSGEDQADSVAFLDNQIYVGGRTTGTMGAAKTGTVDAFVARIDAGTGAVGSTSQYGTVDTVAEGVRLSAVDGGGSMLGALGLHRGTLTPTDSVKLEAQTSLRAGDEFSIRINGGALRKVTIGEKDTLSTLTDRVRQLVGSRVATVTSPLKDDGRSLRIDVKAGNEIQLIAGSGDRDALAKLGLGARRISAPATRADDAPTVRPGGTFQLDLTSALRIDTKAEAANSLARVNQAISFTQSAYRSLYWDDTKAALADTPAKAGKKGGSTVIEKAQLANYQAALTRLSGGSGSYTGF
ncbi:hypothetical protein JAO74_09740 [Sphingomonas sp. BT553]|uniref:Regulatory protein FlaEY n=2 Tax=Sphingomonas mollis TaxID=2795726 RepID=A0ABS0XPY6_9SPHN|nr:hypothetical protein [Sphingomonas sp. BT553]